MNDLSMPATLPSTMKEQLQALAPYMVGYSLKSNGGWVADLKIPIEAFITADFKHEVLAEYDMKLSVTIETPEILGDQRCGRVMNQARYAEVELSYR